MIRLTVLYHAPRDPDAFVDNYQNTHVPLANKIPDMVRWTWGKCLPGPDGSPPPYFLTAELVWESAEVMQASLSSPDGAAATGDVPNFATGGATMVVSAGH